VNRKALLVLAGVALLAISAGARRLFLYAKPVPHRAQIEHPADAAGTGARVAAFFVQISWTNDVNFGAARYAVAAPPAPLAMRVRFDLCSLPVS
jgi:hypothetical protein